MADITILSMNARGLGDKMKRNDVFDYLKGQPHSIYVHQRYCTHINVLYIVDRQPEAFFSSVVNT